MKIRSLLATLAIGVAAGAVITTNTPEAIAHCQVPCGIYDDHAQVEQLLLDTTTIGKANASIINLTQGGHLSPQAFNQSTRWIMTKDDHAKSIQDSIAWYFMAQRIKPVGPESPDYQAYLTSLARHHAVIVAAMKATQTVAPGAADDLAHAIEGIAQYYPAP
jgi:nickel superoxide dismutase